ILAVFRLIVNGKRGILRQSDNAALGVGLPVLATPDKPSPQFVTIPRSLTVLQNEPRRVAHVGEEMLGIRSALVACCRCTVSVGDLHRRARWPVVSLLAQTRTRFARWGDLPRLRDLVPQFGVTPSRIAFIGVPPIHCSSSFTVA